MRPVVASLAPIALGAAMLLPVAIATAAGARNESVTASESVEPSGSALPDASVELVPESETDIARTWAITVKGGTPSVDAVTIDESASSALFTVSVFGPSATVEMTVALPPGWELTFGQCFDFDNQVAREALVGPRRLVLEVVQGGEYDCTYRSGPASAPKPTAPSTNSLPGVPPRPSAGAWPMLLAVMASVLVATLLLAVRTRRVAPGGGKRRRR